MRIISISQTLTIPEMRSIITVSVIDTLRVVSAGSMASSAAVASVLSEEEHVFLA